MRTTSLMRAQPHPGKRFWSWVACVCLLGLAVAVTATACSSESDTGTARVSYLLLDPEGGSLTCEQAGVAEISVQLYLLQGDSEPVHELEVACEVDDDGAGRAVVEFAVGFYMSSQVSLRDEAGQVVERHSGVPAEWEFLAVDITSGGVTDYMPVIEAVFTGDGPVCGDGVMEGSEECDDGNTAAGDGCSADCAIEYGTSCELTVSWAPATADGTPVGCGDIDVLTVDISVFESGTATAVADVQAVACGDASHVFPSVPCLPFSFYDVSVTGLDASAIAVADGTALDVLHQSPGGTVVDVELTAR